MVNRQWRRDCPEVEPRRETPDADREEGCIRFFGRNCKGKALNSYASQFFNPAGIVIDQTNGDVYIADGYGNRRVVVLDQNGRFLRQWGRQGRRRRSGKAKAASSPRSCTAWRSATRASCMCPTAGGRMQVFDKGGKFSRNIWIRTRMPELPDPRGTAWWVAFSPDKEQKYLYVMNGRNEQIQFSITRVAPSDDVRPSGTPTGSIHARPHAGGRQQGEHLRCQTNEGRRIQKFRPVE